MCRRRCKDLLDSCSECERERAAYVEERYEFDLLCQTNPELDPSHRPATDAEWRAWREATTLPAR